MDHGDKPFGLRDIKLTNMAGSTQVDLPAATKMAFKTRVVSGEMHGDDALKALQTYEDALEWELESGGIALDAWALMTGRTAVSSGTTPNEIITYTATAGTNYPYFKIYGKALGDESDDVHVLILKAKLNSGIEGEFGDGEFFVTKCTGLAVDDDVTGIYQVIGHETATALPTS